MTDKRVLSTSQSISLKGISATEIMIGHLGIATGLNILYPNRKAGILFVGIFFMISGYGLMYSYLNKSEYMRHFLRKRMSGLLVPAYIVYLLNGIVEYLNRGGVKPAAAAVIRYLLLSKFMQTTNWFVFEIFLFYILFWVFYKFFAMKIANILLCAVVIFLIFAGFYFKIDNPWYGSSLCFPLGILYAQRERKWNEILLKHYFIKNVVLLSGCGICIIAFFILGNSSMIGNPIARNLAAVSFCMWVLSILQKVRIEYRSLCWLGKISYEIFLLHPVWIVIVGRYVTKPWSYIILVIILTLVSAALLQRLIDNTPPK